MDIVESDKNFKDNRNSRCREQPHYLRAEIGQHPRKRPLTAPKPHTYPGPQSLRERQKGRCSMPLASLESQSCETS